MILDLRNSKNAWLLLLVMPCHSFLHPPYSSLGSMTTTKGANLQRLAFVSPQQHDFSTNGHRKHQKKMQAQIELKAESYSGGGSGSGDQQQEVGGINELHTRLRDAVLEQDYVEAGRISDMLLYKLHGEDLANGSMSGADRNEKLRAYRKRMSWKGLGAAPWLTARLDSLNYTFPTTIQINAMECVNAILKDEETDSSLEERIGRTNMDMGIVISGSTGSGKSLAYLVPMLSTLSDSLFTRQRIRVGAEEAVGDTTGDLLDRLAIVTSPMVRSTARNQIRSDSPIATGAALSTLGKSGKDVRNPLALIVVPSRELGVQIAMVLYQLVGGNIKDSATELSGRVNMFRYKGPKGVRIACVLDDEEASFGLKLQTDVAITMPQYLGKLIEDKDIDASKLRVVIYDEADLALEETPSSTLKALFDDGGVGDDGDEDHDDDGDDDDDEARREYTRLTVLVGASVTEALGNLAVSSRILPPGKSYIATATRFAPLQSNLDKDATTTTITNRDSLLNEPKKASLQDLNLSLYPGLKHYRVKVDDNMGLLILTRLLRKALKDADEKDSQSRPRVVIFFPSEDEARSAMEPLRDALWGEHRLCVLLPKTGVSPLTILDQFRRNETTVMLATPNSVRGLDVKGLTHVYTLYLPTNDPREYVHLAGRVGRVGQASANNGGGANVISILRKSEAPQMEELAQKLGFEFTDLDTTNLSGFMKKAVKELSDDDDEEEESDEVEGDVEAMRRYLEDTINLLGLVGDPKVLDINANVVDTDDDDSESYLQ